MRLTWSTGRAAPAFAPQVLFGAVAGVFADRWDRKRTMIAADLLLAAGLLPLLLVRGSAQIWIVLAVLFWEGAVRVRGGVARCGRDDRRRPVRSADPGRADHAVPARQRGHQPGPGVRRGEHPGGHYRAGRDAGRGLPEPLAGIIPVLAVQGGGYVVAGLAMLVWLNEEPGEPADADADALSQGEPALVAADG